jgi:uncharacterized membrane protein (UPF0182 family)
LYLRASGGRIPELNRVIVAYQDQIVMEETLDAALDRLFVGGGAPGQPRAPSGTSTSAAPAAGRGQPAPLPPLAMDAALTARARQHYDRAMQAQRDGNWALYGEEIRLLGEVLRGTEK